VIIVLSAKVCSSHGNTWGVTVGVAPKLRARELRLNSEKGTDLKGKRLSSPHRFVYKLIVNIKGMNVISHRLHPVLINR
jgi:hypothetical protein